MVRSGINVISTVWNLCDDSMVWSILPPFLNTVAFQVCRHVQITTSFNFAKHWTLLGWSQMLPTATTYYIHVLQIDYETHTKKSKVQKFVKLLYGWRLTASLSSLLDVRIICFILHCTFPYEKCQNVLSIRLTLFTFLVWVSAIICR